MINATIEGIRQDLPQSAHVDRERSRILDEGLRSIDRGAKRTVMMTNISIAADVRSSRVTMVFGKNSLFEGDNGRDRP